MATELTGAFRLAIAVVVLVGVAEGLARRNTVAPEWSRKMIHVGAGLVCLLFPLVLKQTLTVFLLALGFGLVLWLAERSGRLHSLCRVTRRSAGSIYFPLAVVVLFGLTRNRYDLYVSAMLVLTIADSAAALVGSRYGRVRYRTGGIGDTKSVEGSIVFWLLSFTAVAAPLIVSGGHADWRQALLAAFLSASLLTAVEAVAAGGRDNLYIPMLAAFLLVKTATKTVPELALQSASMVLLFALLASANRFGRMLRSRELTTTGIIVFGVWSLGSIDWALPLVVAFLFFCVIFQATGGDQRHSKVYRRMTRLTLPAAGLVLSANLTGEFAFFYGPFIVAILAPLVWGTVVQLGGGSSWRWTPRQVAGATAAVPLVLAQPVLMGRTPEAAGVLIPLAIALLAAWLGIGAAARMRPRVPGGAVAFTFICAAISLAVFAQLSGLQPVWQPSLWADVYAREADVLFPLR